MLEIIHVVGITLNHMLLRIMSLKALGGGFFFSSRKKTLTSCSEATLLRGSEKQGEVIGIGVMPSPW